MFSKPKGFYFNLKWINAYIENHSISWSKLTTKSITKPVMCGDP